MKGRDRRKGERLKEGRGKGEKTLKRGTKKGKGMKGCMETRVKRNKDSSHYMTQPHQGIRTV